MYCVVREGRALSAIMIIFTSSNFAIIVAAIKIENGFTHKTYWFSCVHTEQYFYQHSCNHLCWICFHFVSTRFVSLGLWFVRLCFTRYGGDINRQCLQCQYALHNGVEFDITFSAFSVLFLAHNLTYFLFNMPNISLRNSII